jgi:regulator of telomere elongation helicase 1
MTDPKVILKKHYLDYKSARKNDPSVKMISGREWYSQQASRSVNQAIGRVIRHAQDFGAITLVDSRYAYQSNKS